MSTSDPPHTRRPIHDAFVEVARAFEDERLTPLGLVEEDVPAHFARMEGTMKTTHYALESRRFRGAGGACATLAIMTDTAGGELASVTISCCPPSGNGWPILGVDLVSFRKMMNLVVLDVSPLAPDTADPATEVLAALKPSFEDRLPTRKRPEFVSQTFSDHAIFCAARPDDAAFVADGARRLIQAYAAMLTQGTRGPRAPEEQARMDAWCAAMRTNKKELKALTTIFGDPARVYLDDFLFVFA
jgi:hypothetical protein